jgi:hypothetical protein
MWQMCIPLYVKTDYDDEESMGLNEVTSPDRERDYFVPASADRDALEGIKRRYQHLEVGGKLNAYVKNRPFRPDAAFFGASTPLFDATCVLLCWITSHHFT